MEDAIINKIPFEHLSRKEADAQDYSPYAKMTVALRGYLVFEKRTCDKLSRYELYQRHQHDPHSLKLIMNKTHPKYKFITREQWEGIHTNRTTGPLAETS